MTFRYLSDQDLSVLSEIDDMGPLAKPVDLFPLLKQLRHLYGVNIYVTELFDINLGYKQEWSTQLQTKSLM